MSHSNTNCDMSYISEANSILGVAPETHVVEATKEDEPSITFSDTTLLCKDNDMSSTPFDTPTEQTPAKEMNDLGSQTLLSGQGNEMVQVHETNQNNNYEVISSNMN